MSFFSGFLKVTFSEFKTMQVYHHFIPLVSLNDFFYCKFVGNTKFLNMYISHTHTYTNKGIQFQNMSVWKTHVTFDVSQRSDILKLVFLMYIYLDRWIDR